VKRVVEFLRDSTVSLDAIGIGSFGPIDLQTTSKTFGHITSTPKADWRNFNLVGAIQQALHSQIGFDTDVNAAALGEARWGAGVDIRNFVYLTVGTGIGGGAIVNGDVVHGLLHPEMGHIRIPHDIKRDPFPGICSYHKDCLEGLASGPALASRWGHQPRELAADHPAWALEAHYLALALATWVCTLSPQSFILGGGVMRQTHLFPLIRAELTQLLNGYIQAEELLSKVDQFVVAPQLGNNSGVLGALVLAERAYNNSKTNLRANAT
jgi:fructokinase